MSHSDLLNGLATSVVVLETAQKLAQARRRLADAEAAHPIASPLADRAYAEAIEKNRDEWEKAQSIIRNVRLQADQARTAAVSAIEAEEDEAAKAALPKPETVYAAALAERKLITEVAEATIRRIRDEAIAAQDAIIGPIIAEREAASLAIATLQEELNATLTIPDEPVAQSTVQPTDVRPDEETDQWQALMVAGHA